MLSSAALMSSFIYGFLSVGAYSLLMLGIVASDGFCGFLESADRCCVRDCRVYDTRYRSLSILLTLKSGLSIGSRSWDKAEEGLALSLPAYGIL